MEEPHYKYIVTRSDMDSPIWRIIEMELWRKVLSTGRTAVEEVFEILISSYEKKSVKIRDDEGSGTKKKREYEILANCLCLELVKKTKIMDLR